MQAWQSFPYNDIALCILLACVAPFAPDCESRTLHAIAVVKPSSAGDKISNPSPEDAADSTVSGKQKRRASVYSFPRFYDQRARHALSDESNRNFRDLHPRCLDTVWMSPWSRSIHFPHPEPATACMRVHIAKRTCTAWLQIAGMNLASTHIPTRPTSSQQCLMYRCTVHVLGAALVCTPVADADNYGTFRLQDMMVIYDVGYMQYSVMLGSTVDSSSPGPRSMDKRA